MPNWCYNNVEIHFDSDKEQELRNAIEKEGNDFFNLLVPRPDIEDENWYDWNISNWGTKWDAKPFDVEWESDSVNFKIETAWGPPIRFYEAMQDKGYSIDAFYLEEGMAFVGHYEDGFDDFYEYGNLSADEMEEQLPAWVEDEYNIITYQREREAEEEDEEDDEEPTYEMTDWFNVKTKPVHKGWYEVRTVSWPFPHKAEWSGKKWLSDNEVSDWRGLTQREHELLKGLDELIKEFDAIIEQ